MQMTADISDIRVQDDGPQTLNTTNLILGLATLARSPAITIRQARRRDMPISLPCPLRFLLSVVTVTNGTPSHRARESRRNVFAVTGS
jgi:hypothetical protein